MKMEQKHIAIRADGDAHIGMGHLMRCLSIALACQKQQISVTFITNNAQSQIFLTEKGFPCRRLEGTYGTMEDEIEDTCLFLKEERITLILVDSYQASEQYLSLLRREVTVFYMDDLGKKHLPVDGIINYNIYGQEMEYEKYYSQETALLLGSFYAPVKEAFLQTPYTVRKEVSNILITMGGSDSYNIAGQLGRLLSTNISEQITITLVCGRFSPHLEEVRQMAETIPNIKVLTDVPDMWNVMQQSDLAIAAAGSTIYELCTMGVPTICCYYVENQRRIAQVFAKKTSMCNAGDFSKEPEKVLQKIQEHTLKLMQEETMRIQLSKEMSSVSDGKGAERIAKFLRKYH